MPNTQLENCLFLCFLTLLWVWSRSPLRHRTPSPCRCIVCLWKTREACTRTKRKEKQNINDSLTRFSATFMNDSSRWQIPDDEVTLDGFQDLLLKQHVLLLSLGNNVLLADSLHGVIFPMIHSGHLRNTKTIFIFVPISHRNIGCCCFKFTGVFWFGNSFSSVYKSADELN